MPVGPYGVTKLKATRLVTGSGLPATVLRVFNPVGAGMARDSMPGMAASAMADALASGRDAITLGDLSARRDFVDVRDVAEAAAAASRHETLPAVINVGSGRATPATASWYRPWRRCPASLVRCRRLGTPRCAPGWLTTSAPTSAWPAGSSAGSRCARCVTPWPNCGPG